MKLPETVIAAAEKYGGVETEAGGVKFLTADAALKTLAEFGITIRLADNLLSRETMLRVRKTGGRSWTSTACPRNLNPMVGEPRPRPFGRAFSRVRSLRPTTIWTRLFAPSILPTTSLGRGTCGAKTDGSNIPDTTSICICATSATNARRQRRRWAGRLCRRGGKCQSHLLASIPATGNGTSARHSTPTSPLKAHIRIGTSALRTGANT